MLSTASRVRTYHLYSMLHRQDTTSTIVAIPVKYTSTQYCATADILLTTDTNRAATTSQRQATKHIVQLTKVGMHMGFLVLYFCLNAQQSE
jgi:hypothetical protein